MLNLSVENMHCEACARRVTILIQRESPEAGVKVAISDKRVTVDGQVDTEALVAALAAAGYPVTAINETR